MSFSKLGYAAKKCQTERDRFLVEVESIKPNHTIRDYIWLSLFSGARRDNVLSIKWTEINLTEGTWRIPMTKNGTPQIIPLPVPAIELLAEQRQIFEKTRFLFSLAAGLLDT